MRDHLSTPRIAWAVVYDEHDGTAQVFVAEDEYVLTRVLALKLVAPTLPSAMSDSWLAEIRDDLLEERWGAAVAAWVAATGVRLDAFPDEELWTGEAVELASLEIRLSRIFQDPPDDI